MDREARVRGVLTEMLDGVELTPQEVGVLVSRARDVAYWSALAPGLDIGQPAPPPEAADDAAAAQAIAELRRDRYFKTGPVFSAAALAALNRAVDAVQAAQWPPVFALVYDCFWTCVRHSIVSRVAAGHLGPGYRQIPHVWVHVVPARAGALGWMPHFDGFRSRRLSVWIALTDASIDNGCMHVVAPDSVPESFRTTDVEAVVVMRDVLRVMHATRALPVAAGSVLGWECDVFHWGGRAAAPRAERRSISLEFLGDGEPPQSDETPLIAVTGPLPSFAERLGVIAVALRLYAAREASPRRFRALVPGLLGTGL